MEKFTNAQHFGSRYEDIFESKKFLIIKYNGDNHFSDGYGIWCIKDQMWTEWRWLDMSKAQIYNCKCTIPNNVRFLFEIISNL